MSTNRHIDRICCAALALVLILTALSANAKKLGIKAADTVMGYETGLFDASAVHTIDIVMDDWEGFLDTCENEEYSVCSVVIDKEAYKNVGIRAKGNTSLSSVAAYGNDRYSFKIEFDHYDNTKSYYGLDKISLNNIIQDNTYMKDFLSCQMMGKFGVDAPLCSFVFITVNGEEWGLYLAVEGVEESFLNRNYGNDYGELYKPDSMSMGGGHGNGRDFDLEDFNPEEEFPGEGDAPGNRDKTEGEASGTGETGKTEAEETPEETGRTEVAETPEETGDSGTGNSSNGRKEMEFDKTLPEEMKMPGQGDIDGMGKGMMGSDDVSLIYTDDDYDSYSNIFDNAKTEITDSDKNRLIRSLKALNEGENIEEVVDVDEVMRYFTVHNFVCNFDSYTGSMIHNYYLYEEDGVLSMIPWDYNLAFGGFLSRSDASSLVNNPIDTPVSGGTVESRPMLAWIFESEQYTQMYHRCFTEFIEECFDSGYVKNLIGQTYELIAPYVEKDPTKFCTYEEFETGVSALTEFCLLRAESIKGQLDGTIPSTSEGQEADASALVDASQINISDMGTMGNTMRQGKMPGRNENADQADNTDNSQTQQKVSQDEETENDDSGISQDAMDEIFQVLQMPGQDSDGGVPEMVGNSIGSSGNTAGHPPL